MLATHRRRHVRPARRAVRHDDPGAQRRALRRRQRPGSARPPGASCSRWRPPSTASGRATCRRASRSSRASGSTTTARPRLRRAPPAPARAVTLRAEVPLLAARRQHRRTRSTRAPSTSARRWRCSPGAATPTGADRPALGRHAGGPPRLRQHRRRPDRTGDRMTGTLLDDVVPARAPWSAVVRAGDVLTIVDLGGNQAVDFLVFDAADTTAALQRARHDPGPGLGVPDHRLGAARLRVRPADDGRRRRGRPARHPRRRLLARSRTPCATATTPGPSTPARRTSSPRARRYGLGKRDLVSNINWYMNVPVDPDGALGIVDGISAPGPVGLPARRARRPRPGLATARRSTTRATASTRRRSAWS